MVNINLVLARKKNIILLENITAKDIYLHLRVLNDFMVQTTGNNMLKWK